MVTPLFGYALVVGAFLVLAFFGTFAIGRFFEDRYFSRLQGKAYTRWVRWGIWGHILLMYLSFVGIIYFAFVFAGVAR